MDEVVGATHVGGKYALTTQPFLLEGSSRILEMGSRTIKLWLNRSAANNYPFHSDWASQLAGVDSITKLIQTPYYRQALDLPFATVVLMTTEYRLPNWKDGVSATEAAAVTQEFRELTEYLLETYRGTGRTFILSNWESDNHIGLDLVPSEQWPVQIQGMIDWVNARQAGIEQGRAAVGMDGVAVFGAFEVNQIPVHRTFDWPVTVDTVVPHTSCDLYSYSNWGTKVPGEEWQIIDNLDYIASKAPSSAYFGERNVYLGEWGAYEVSFMQALDPDSPDDTRVHDAESDAMQRQVVMRNLDLALRWGVPYALYWQVYGNGLRNGVSVPLGQNALEEQLKGVWLIRPPSNVLGLPYSYTSTWGSLAELMTTHRLFDDLEDAEGLYDTSEAIAWHRDAPAWALGDDSRVGPVEGSVGAYLVYRTREEIREVHVSVFAPVAEEIPLALSVSADGIDWSPLPFQVEHTRENGEIARSYLRPSGSVPTGMRYFGIAWSDTAAGFPQIGAVALQTGDHATLDSRTAGFVGLDEGSGNWQIVPSALDTQPALQRTDAAPAWIVHRHNALAMVEHTLLQPSGAIVPLRYASSYDGRQWTELETAYTSAAASLDGLATVTCHPVDLPVGTRYLRAALPAEASQESQLLAYNIEASPRPISVDSDGDGWLDLEEAWMGTDPFEMDHSLLLEPSINNERLLLRFGSRLGVSYRLESTSDLSRPWQTEQTLEGTSPSSSFIERQVDPTLRFYRVRLAPW